MNADFAAVTTGHDRCAGGAADGSGGETVGEADAFAGESIETGGPGILVSGAAHRPSSLIIGDDEENVGGGGFGRGEYWSHKTEQEEAQEMSHGVNSTFKRNQ